MAKFNVGDKVVCKARQNKSLNKYVEVGQECVVTGVHERWFAVDMKNPTEDDCVLSEMAFDLVEAAQKKQNKWLKATPERIAQLQVGDKVKLRNSTKFKVVFIENLGNDPLPIYLEDGDWYPEDGRKHGYDSAIDIVKIRNKEYVKE